MLLSTDASLKHSFHITSHLTLPFHIPASSYQTNSMNTGSASTSNGGGEKSSRMKEAPASEVLIPWRREGFTSLQLSDNGQSASSECSSESGSIEHWGLNLSLATTRHFVASRPIRSVFASCKAGIKGFFKRKQYQHLNKELGLHEDPSVVSMQSFSSQLNLLPPDETDNAVFGLPNLVLGTFAAATIPMKAQTLPSATVHREEGGGDIIDANTLCGESAVVAEDFQSDAFVLVVKDTLHQSSSSNGWSSAPSSTFDSVIHSSSDSDQENESINNAMDCSFDAVMAQFKCIESATKPCSINKVVDADTTPTVGKHVEDISLLSNDPTTFLDSTMDDPSQTGVHLMNISQIISVSSGNCSGDSSTKSSIKNDPSDSNEQSAYPLNETNVVSDSSGSVKSRDIPTIVSSNATNASVNEMPSHISPIVIAQDTIDAAAPANLVRGNEDLLCTLSQNEYSSSSSEAVSSNNGSRDMNSISLESEEENATNAIDWAISREASKRRLNSNNEVSL